MSDWNFKLLEEWDEKICRIAEDAGLDWHPITYEVCDYYQMIGHMSYHGLPSHYQHWSYGKSFERTHQMYNMGAEGLPYELIINSNPSIAYLMRENPAYLQILIMAHCVGHSDFFKNNRTFAKTRPNSVCGRFRNARKRIQGYIEDPSIGIEKVEEILDAAHAVKYQIDRYQLDRPTHKELKKTYTDRIKNDTDGQYIDFDIDKIPLEPQYDVLKFIIEHGRIKDWQKDILEIVHDESLYFMPQIRTKIMNEGWASFWHYRISNALELPQEYHIPFIKSHNQVIRPHIGAVNPYHLGFKLFEKIEERHGLDRCFLAREVGNDQSFLREYLIEDDCKDLNLFAYSKKRKGVYSVDEISDVDGWKNIKESLIKGVGEGTIPKINVIDVEKEGNVLVLQHEHDGRDLELNYADEVVKHISTLWGDTVKLLTIVEEEPWEI
ncbi:MAG: stage V sporulation protein R [Halobacteriovorax sp.]|nr:stage V sporulation protein R [Halobacteriovorax sp.]|tara:strand:- start:650 stop:1960 length:1311 start_codon:yes stop_codon:yes gene_type:complete